MRHPLDLLEEIREKPEPARKLIGGVLVIVVMFVIVGVWATTLDLSISSQPASALPADPNSPLRIFWNFLKDLVKLL